MEKNYRDVLVIVDGTTLLAAHPDASRDPDAPTVIDGRSVYVLSTGATSLEGRDGAQDLPVLKVGDELHLRGSAHSLRAEESVLFYRFAPDGPGRLSAPDIVSRDAMTPVTDSADLLQPKYQRTTDHFWRCEALTAGVVICTLGFLMLGRDETLLGYFRGDARFGVEAA